MNFGAASFHLSGRWLSKRVGGSTTWSSTLTTPIAAGVLGALMLVSFVTDHRKAGFFVSSRAQGFEYVVSLGVMALVVGGIGPGEWSLDHGMGLVFPFQAPNALIITGLVGL